MQDFYVNNIKIDWSQISKDSYLQKISSIKNLKNIKIEKPVTFFSGENGSGKSTLLEAIAKNYGFNEEGGTLNMRFQTFNDASELYNAVILAKGKQRRFGYFFRAETFFNVASEYENLRSYSGGSNAPNYHAMSHGESFLEYIEGFDSPGLFLLDEPEAALSQNRQMEFLLFLNKMIARGAQFIIATHSPILLSFPNADILKFSEEGTKKIPYEESDSYKLTELFINHKERILKQLFED